MTAKKKPGKKKTTANPKPAPRKAKNRDNSDIVIGLLLLLLAVFTAISLFSFKQAGTNEVPLNWGGFLGLHLARFLYAWLGVMAFTIPLLLRRNRPAPVLDRAAAHGGLLSTFP